MSLTGWILLGCLIAFIIKYVGYLLPRSYFERDSFRKISDALTIGLLAGLVAANTFTDGQQLALDSRSLALAAAGFALWRKAPFLLVVVAGALASALGRLAGLP